MLYAHVYVFLEIYMLPIAGQTAGPNGLKFVERTLRCPGINIG